MSRQIKEFDDAESQKRIEEFVRLSIKNRDTVDFNFEADLKVIMKKLNVKRLVENDKEYLHNFVKMIIRMYEKIYLEETITIGRRQGSRFINLFTEAA